MKRKVIGGLLASFLIGTTVYGASLHGDYKGHPILTLTSNGKQLSVTDVPAMNFEDRTVVPVYLLRQLGLQVNYDSRTQSVDVELPESSQPQPESKGLSLSELNKIGDSVGYIETYDRNGSLLGTGSGFVTDGIFVTAAHVIKGGSKIDVWYGNDRTEINVSDAVFNDTDKDLAGFKFSGVTSLTLNAEPLTKGELVYELGYPLRKFRIYDGEFEFMSASHTVVITATSDHGDSGGVVINDQGEVIGIMVGINEGIQGGHAIPAKVLQDELDKL